MTSDTTQNKNQQNDFQYYLIAFIRRRWFFAVPLIVFFGLAVILSFIIPKKYEASAIILVNDRRITEPLVAEAVEAPDVREMLNALSKQVLTWPKLEQLAAQLHMADDIKAPLKRKEFIEKLRDRVDVTMKGKDLVTITYQDRNPALAQKVANTLSLNFIDEDKRIKREVTYNTINFIAEQLQIYRNKLENSQKDFSVNRIDSELRIAMNRKKLLESRLAGLETLIPSQVTMEQNPVLAQLQAQLVGYKTELARVTIDAKEGNPVVAKLERLIKEIQGKINEIKEKETVKESVSVTNPLYLQTAQDLKQVEMEMDYLNKRAYSLKTNSGSGGSVTEEELVTLERNKQVDADIYQMLLRQLEAAYVSNRLADSEKGSEFTIIEYARLPLEPVSPNKKKIVFAGLFLGCAVGAGLVLLLEQLDKSFRNITEAKEFLTIPYLGAISKMVVEDDGTVNSAITKVKMYLNRFIMGLLRKYQKLSVLEFVSPFRLKKYANSTIAPQVITFHEPESIIAEEYRVLRTNVEILTAGESPKIIMVTGAGKGEGKSTTAVNLAIVMAENGKKTLLVDCDLRRSTVNTLLGLPQSPGLVDVLKGTTEFDSAIRECDVKNLAVLSRGTSATHTSELFDSKKARNLFSELKKRFNCIIVDTPPILNLPDSRILAKYVDIVLLVVQMERTQREDVMSSLAALKGSNGNVPRVSGFVLTNLRYYLPMYPYNYYYYKEAAHRI